MIQILMFSFLDKNEPMLIVADYDCDGATACAVGLKGLRALGAPWNINIDYFVPNRFTLGYGLTPEVVDLVSGLPDKPDILITVDNGIASVAGTNSGRAGSRISASWWIPAGGGTSGCQPTPAG